MNCTVLCADAQCRHNSGGGYYGRCKHPATKEPHYTGGIDRLYRETCKLREIDGGRIVITGGGRGVGKSFLEEAIKKCFEEGQNDCTEVD